MVVIISDAEAENIAQVLRRMAERIDDADGVNMAHVNDRGPNDFANQLEALVDAGDPKVHIPIGDHETGPAFVTPVSARTFASNHGFTGKHTVPVRDPRDDEPDVIEP